MPKGHWAYDAVEYCYEKGIVGGVSANLFGRDYQIRRGDFMLMLYNAVGRPAVSTGCTFTDVSQSDYYYTALAWAQSAGLASGTGDGSYSPTSSVTREQAFTILRKAMPLLGKTCPDASLSVLNAFSDKDQIADYAKGHTATLVAQGVVSGKGTGIDPKGNLTRAEMAALLYKLMTYTPITDVPTDPVTPDQPSQPDTPETPDTPDTPVTPDQPDTPDTPAQEVFLTLDVSQLALNAGESRTLIATLDPAQTGAAIAWSCDSSAAAVAADGTVTNLNTAAGTVQATITATWSGKSASCTVDCQPAQRTGTVFDADVGLNVRSGPGTTNPVVDRRSNGDVLIVESVENGWCKVLYRNAAGQAAPGLCLRRLPPAIQLNIKISEPPRFGTARFAYWLYPLGWLLCQAQAVATMVFRSANWGFQPRTDLALSEEATSWAGSPARRGQISAGMGWPVTARATSMTSFTEKPTPLPRLNTLFSPPERR